MYGATHEFVPDYITELVKLTSATSGWSHLHSVDSLTFEIMGTYRGRLGVYFLELMLCKWTLRMYTVSRKRDQLVFVISSTKLGQFG